MGLFGDDPRLVHEVVKLQHLMLLLLSRDQALLQQGRKIMTKLDDAKAAEDAALAALKVNTDRLGAVKAALDGQTAKIEDLKTQLAEAIEAGGHEDDEGLQAVLDGANAILAATDTQATAEAALLDTGPAPAPASPNPPDPNSPNPVMPGVTQP